MGLEIAVRFAKPVPMAEVDEILSGIEGLVPNGDQGLRWENEDLEGFFTIDYVEPAKQKKRKPRLEGLDITVPWGGPTEEITLLAQILDSLAEKWGNLTASSETAGYLNAGEFGRLEPAWHQANVEALVAYANQDVVTIRHRRERFDDDDPSRIEVLDATQMSVEPDQREAFQANCAMRVAQAFQRCGEHKLAIVTAHRVLESRPKEPYAHILLGTSFSALGDNGTARKVYERTIELDPEGQYADYARAMVESLGG
ncbi:hypothetical protein JXA47_06995 [Candidatus Sumerlaeota bacterium]|nr:hypothetical protein [Candidatus Sumerlaeota bacterium]